MPSTTILSDNGASSGSAGIKTTGGNDGTLLLQTTTSGGTATTGLTINTVQGVFVPNTIGVGGATPSTSGAGISFPATQSASSDANTLDDYEEGTWTPTDGSGAGLTFSIANTATYRKVGSLVFVVFYITYPSTSNTNPARVSGLPFTANSTYCYLSGRCGALTAGTMRLQINSGEATIVPYSGETLPTNAQLSGAYMIFSGCYIAAS